MAEFTHVGGYCSLSTCKRRDFLPFECKWCNDQFCMDHFKHDHRTYLFFFFLF